MLVRAKLDTIAAGLVTFDQEFLAYVIVPGGATVFQATAAGIAAAYDAANDQALGPVRARPAGP